MEMVHRLLPTPEIGDGPPKPVGGGGKPPVRVEGREKKRRGLCETRSKQDSYVPETRTAYVPCRSRGALWTGRRDPLYVVREEAPVNHKVSGSIIP